MRTRYLANLAMLWCATAWGQVDFGAQCTPKQRCDALRQSFATAKPGDTINVPAGVYADANFPAFPQGVRVVGAGRGKTIFQSPDILGLQDQNCFELRDGSVVESLTMQSIGPKDQQICVCGFNGDQAGPRSAVVKDCEVLGGCWGVYTWVSTSPKLRIENCLIRTARVGVTAGASGGASSQFVDIVNSRIVMDPALSTYGVPWDGESVTHKTWGGVVGILCRGGKTTIDNVTVEVNGPPVGTGPRAVAVTDWLDLGSSTQAVVEVSGLKTKIVPNAAVEKFDIDVRYGTLRFKDSFGTGKGGALSIANLPPLTK